MTIFYETWYLYVYRTIRGREQYSLYKLYDAYYIHLYVLNSELPVAGRRYKNPMVYRFYTLPSQYGT